MPLSGIGRGEINHQYRLYPNDNSQGLLKTQQLYEDNKIFLTDDYDFGYLTELYFNLQNDQRDHWRQGVADLQEIQAPIKSVIIAALTSEPPLEIEWSWGGKPPGSLKKGVVVAYDSANPKYYIGIFGYKPPITEELAQRLAQRAQRNDEKKST